MALERYRAKRDFRKTPEPAGEAVAGEGRRFVIQKHAARRLHYDFRLELEGVLKSWAVPKGPSLDPSEKRLAVHVEDHPVEYGGFEGVIPKGQYGGGTVLLWDRGTWEPEEEPVEGYRKGQLKFRLHGQKLKGSWALVRIRSRDPKEDNWLLIKHRDEAARPLSEGDILEERPESIATGRRMEAIAAAGDRVWHSDRPAAEAEERRAPRTTVDAATVPGARKARMPARIEPQLATRVEEAPDGDEWLHELKLDGYRALGRIDRGEVRLVTRKGLDWTDRFAPLARALAALPVERALVDGEVAVLTPEGTTSFQALQEALSENRPERLVYFAFDLLHLDDRDLTRSALEDRKAALAEILRPLAGGPLRYSDHVVGQGPDFLDQACRHEVEGIVSKKRRAPYRPGRGRDWLKAKCEQRQDFVVGGWTEPEGSRSEFGALLVGFHKDGKLRYAGKVGTGFNETSLRDLARRLKPLARKSSPFDDDIPRADARRAHWVRPRLVAEISFGEWTRDGRLRHPVYQGLREDLPASEVTREGSVPVERAAPAKPAAPRVTITNPERVLWPEPPVTKADLVRYYETVGERMLPHVRGRPLTMVRCPQGIDGECFYQKHAEDGFPEILGRVPIEEDGERRTYAAIEDADGLIALAQMAVLEIHDWGSRAGDLERPDRVIFDLDPDPAVAWKDVVAAARDLRARLEELGLAVFLKTTGGKGLHLEVPIEPEHGWDAVKAFAKLAATRMVREEPGRYVVTATKARRKGKIYIDYLRNARGASAIAPYSTRRRPGAPLALPVRWQELGRLKEPAPFTLRGSRRRYGSSASDPWGDYEESRRFLTPAIEALLEQERER